jgi:non-specific serine/threonine protein kinase/serine/threonine-protein kinase
LTPGEWSAVKEILGEVLDRPAADRSAYLDRACGGDADLRRRVEALIEADEKDWDLLETPAAESSSLMSSGRLPAAGDRIGAYEISREIGHGGMGIVYLARRADEQFERRVAIKIARAGFAGDPFERRFRAERQIVANLDHPNIGRLLDGGATPDGRPYLVMEHVEGQPLTQWCEARGLGTTERLEIFLEVCAAVQYAHQHLVVHRDLKPANILVTAQGVVKLLDFGIAKLIDPDLTDAEVERTGTLFRVLTPDYASPEQFRGEPISTASDVYALGVVLYELLTGERPYRLAGASAAEMMSIVCEREPSKPSTVAPSGRSRDLAGDLDTIVLTALRKEPRRRFASAAALAGDIRRHLSGLPVEARTDTFGYRAGKFVRRHRSAVAATALIALSLAVGLAMILREARRARAAEARAERRFSEVRQLANSIVFELHDQIKDLPGSTPARQALVQRGVEFLDRLALERGDDPSLVRELAAAYQRIGDVQGNPYQANLGDLAGAARSYKKALDLLASVPQDRAVDGDQEAISSLSLRSSGLELAAGHPDRAVAMSGRALGLRRALLEKRPADDGRRRELATALRVHAYCLSGVGRQAEALGCLREQAETLRSLLQARPNDDELRRELGQNRYVIGLALDKSGDPRGAAEALAEAAELQKGLVSSNPGSVALHRDLYWSLTDIGGLALRAGDPSTALERYREAMDVASAVDRADPKSIDGRTLVAIADVNLGDALERRSELPAARQHRAEARVLLESLFAAHASNGWLGGILADLYKSIADEQRRHAASRRDLEGACDLYGRSLDLFAKLKAAGRLQDSRAADFQNVAGAVAACRSELAASAGTR